MRKRHSTEHTILLFWCIQVSRAVWLGKWNPKRDREPDKKDEVAFKEFLIAKYERKSWYCSPAEVKKEEKELPKPEPKLQPPPPSNKVCRCAQFLLSLGLSLGL